MLFTVTGARVLDVRCDAGLTIEQIRVAMVSINLDILFVGDTSVFFSSALSFCFNVNLELRDDHMAAVQLGVKEIWEVERAGKI